MLSIVVLLESSSTSSFCFDPEPNPDDLNLLQVGTVVVRSHLIYPDRFVWVELLQLKLITSDLINCSKPNPTFFA